MTNDILVVDNFASPGTCDWIIAAFDRHRATCTHKVGDGFFDNRVMWASAYPKPDNVRPVLRALAHRCTNRVAEHFEVSPIYCDGIQTVIWEGPAMPLHQDDRHPRSNEPHPTPWRFLASIVYLNDDYDGGEIYFPERDISIKPTKGQLVAFPGKWVHGVRAVTNGVRYTAPAWYSRDRFNEDPFLRGGASHKA